jgi:hypothetical protein
MADNKIDAFYIRWISGVTPYFDYQMKSMWASVYLNIPTVNGYSGRRPIGYNNVAFVMSKGDISRWLIKEGTPGKTYKIFIIEAIIIDDSFIVKNKNIFDFHILQNDFLE